ncbi:MAG TPA: hypothetical protein VFZ78_02890 [Flavisolibacter sp.]
MKQLFFALFLAGTIASTSFAAEDVRPGPAVRTFHSMFSRASNVNWSEAGQYQVASFNMGVRNMSAYFTKEGDLAVLVESITTSGLPRQLRQALDTMNGCIIRNVYRVEQGDEISFIAMVETGGRHVSLKSAGRKWMEIARK